MSLDSDSSTSLRSITPTRSPDQSQQFDINVFSAGNDSLNGLMDSMLQEASIVDSDPQTPESQNRSLPLVNDTDLTVGGDEGGVPHGRMHHADRVRMHQEEFYLEEHGADISFSSIVRSTPPKTVHNEVLHEHLEQSTPRTPVATVLPRDVELAEDDMPLGRLHHADRSRFAHMQAVDAIVDEEVRMLPPSPSPGRRAAAGASRERSLTESVLPKFDLGAGIHIPNVDRESPQNSMFR